MVKTRGREWGSRRAAGAGGGEKGLGKGHLHGREAVGGVGGQGATDPVLGLVAHARPLRQVELVLHVLVGLDQLLQGRGWMGVCVGGGKGMRWWWCRGQTEEVTGAVGAINRAGAGQGREGSAGQGRGRAGAAMHEAKRTWSSLPKKGS